MRGKNCLFSCHFCLSYFEMFMVRWISAEIRSFSSWAGRGACDRGGIGMSKKEIDLEFSGNPLILSKLFAVVTRNSVPQIGQRLK